MSFPAAKIHPSEGSPMLPGRNGVGPALVRRECDEHSPGPAPLALKLLREAQTRLDRMDGVPGKADLRHILDETQRALGGSDEWGRRADGSRPRRTTNA